MHFYSDPRVNHIILRKGHCHTVFCVYNTCPQSNVCYLFSKLYKISQHFSVCKGSRNIYCYYINNLPNSHIAVRIGIDTCRPLKAT